ncbi:MAG: hypothetical protein A3J24_11675 [Deltaproteobacteria bacterium RIFCSPLOWO2_02_FULL_53_8]|nr:MAG: hypothetical protein A3J24_11675 [Deltaproteobacteria bacterium RIFCSPLOWO2_02_FULL_53_8]
MKSRPIAYLSAIVYMAVILVMSVMPAQGPQIENLDKLEHFAAYAIMGGLWIWALEARSAGKLNIIMSAVVISAVFGALVEVCQSFTQTRTASFLDALANGFGAIAGSYVFARIRLK